MTWLGEAMKDGVSTDMLREAANWHRSEEFRMGQPSAGYTALFSAEFNRRIKAIPGELKHLSTLRKRNHRDSLSSGERRGNSLNLFSARKKGVAGPRCGIVLG